MRQAITPEDLLNIWRKRRAAFILQAANNKQNRPVVEIMIFQLDKCIEELEATLTQEYSVKDFLEMMVPHETGIRAVNKSNPTGVERRDAGQREAQQ